MSSDDLSYEERGELSTTVGLPQSSPYRKVEHTPHGSFADTTHLDNPRLHRTDHLDCEATHASGSGHSGPATHFIRLEGESEEQATPVCSAHLGKILENSVSRGEYGVQQRRIRPEDVAPHKFLRGVQRLEIRTTIEGMLHAGGLTGEDAITGRKGEELGKGGGKGLNALEEAKSRRTPEQQSSTLERALENVREGGGHPIPSPKEMADVYSENAKLNRVNNPENYEPVAVRSPDGRAEGVPTPTRKYKFNSAGVPNTRGGRKKKPAEPGDSKDMPLGQGSGLVDKVYNQIQAKRAGQPFEQVSMTEDEKAQVLDVFKGREERRAAGIPEEGIRPRGFSKTNNRAISVTVTQLEKPEGPSGVEKYAAARTRRLQKESRSRKEDEAAASRLRDIEAKRQRESRLSVFTDGGTPKN